MPVFTRTKQRISQPQYLVKADISSPICYGLQAIFFPAGGMVDVVAGVLPSTNTGTATVGISGRLVAYTGGQQTIFPRRSGYDLTSAMTIVVIADITTLSNYGALVSSHDTNTTNGWEFRVGDTATDSNIIIHRANSGGFKQYHASTSNLLSAGTKNNFISVVYADGNLETVPKFNVNGVSYTGSVANATTGTGVQAASTHPLYIGTREDAVTKLDGAISLILLFNRALSFSELENLRANPYQIFQPITRNIWIPNAAVGGATTIDTTPIVWQWETNNVVATEKVETNPVDWQWLVTTSAITENISTSPIIWQWETTTGSIQEGAATTIDCTPVVWQWEQNTASFVTKLDTTPIDFQWEVTIGSVTENINANIVDWQWETTSGSILGQDTISANAGVWEWEVTQGNVVYLQPQQTSGTIGGKKDKHLKQPFYDKEQPYESKIDLDEAQRNDNRVVADLLDVRGDVLRDGNTGNDKPIKLVNRPDVQSVNLVGDLVERLTPKVEQVSIELPQVEESEGFDEEAAVIMLLLAA